MGTISALILCLLVWTIPAFTQSIDLVLVEEYSFGSFQRATRIVAASNGMLYVLDADENKLFQFVNPHDPPSQIGGFGWTSTSFDRPTGVATDGINVYVSDFGNHRIQRFDRSLTYISSLSTRDTSDVASRFGYPLDIAMSELGDLFVLDGENLRVLTFDPRYFFVRSFGDINAGKGRLQNPIKLMATISRISVGEQNRIVVFDYFGNYLGSIGDGVVSELTCFTLLDIGFLAASSDTIWWFSREGVLQKSMPLNHLLIGEKIDRIQDIAFHGERLFILSPRRVHAFKMVN